MFIWFKHQNNLCVSLLLSHTEGAWVLSHFGCVWLFVTLWTVAHQAPPSMGFFRQEHWIGLPFPPPGDLPHPGIEPTSLLSPGLAGGVFFLSLAPPGKPLTWCLYFMICILLFSLNNRLWRLLCINGLSMQNVKHIFYRRYLLLPR